MNNNYEWIIKNWWMNNKKEWMNNEIWLNEKCKMNELIIKN